MEVAGGFPTDYTMGVHSRAPRLLGLLILALTTLGAAKPNSTRKAAQRERMQVLDVVSTSDSQFVVVLKTEAQPVKLLPIWVGAVEALAIRMRLDRQTPPRPLTLNLLESVLSTGRITVVEIAIDDLKSGVFLGRLRLKRDGRRWDIDARPSDAIGLAVGAGVPIFVSPKVLSGAGFDPEDIESFKDDDNKGGDKESDAGSGSLLEESL